MVISSYNSTRGEVTDQEPQQTEYIHRSSTWRQYAYGNSIINNVIIIINTILNSSHHLAGVFLASLSGILFTANNFVINQTQVDVGDVILVRTLLQISIYVSILLYREERFLPATSSQKLYTILQGKEREILTNESEVKLNEGPLCNQTDLIFNSKNLGNWFKINEL